MRKQASRLWGGGEMQTVLEREAGGGGGPCGDGLEAGWQFKDSGLG